MLSTAVRVTTQQQWDIVIKTCRTSYYNSFLEYPDICIDISTGCYCSQHFFKKEGYKIISFFEWQDTYLDAPVLSSVNITPVIVNVTKI